MAPPLLLLLLSLFLGSNARRCCTEDYFINTTSGKCETNDFFKYTSLFVNFTESPEPPNCEIPEDTCFGVVNNTLTNVGCNDTYPTEQPARLRVCCPHKQVYSMKLHICLEDTDNQRIDQLLADNIREEFALLVHGPLDKCRGENAIVDVTINSSQVILDESVESGFYVEGHPELTGDNCLAVSDDDQSLVVRVCKPKSFACSSGKICYRRCCPDGMGFYGDKIRCRPIWQPLDLEIYQRNDSGGNLIQVETPVSYSLLHTVTNCDLYHLDPNDTSEKWHLLNDGRLLQDEDNDVIENDRFCIDYFQVDHEGYLDGLNVLMCGRERVETMDWIKVIGYSFSCLFLVLTIIVYLIVPRLFNLHGKTLICYALWLFIFYLLTGYMHLIPMSHDTCYIVGHGLFFSFLSAVGWMNIRCFDIWWTLGRSHSGHTSKNSKSQMERKRFFMYFLYATGLPIAFISLCLLLENTSNIPKDYRPNIAEDGKCYFSDEGHGKLIYYVLPLAILLSANTIFFTLTVRNFLKIRNEIEKMQDTPTTKEGKKKKLQNDKAKFFTNAKLFVVMGVIWMFEVFSSKIYPYSWVWYFPDVINALHGLLIFVIYVCKKNIIKELRKVWNKSKQDMKTSSSSGTISTITSSSDQTQL